MAEKKKVKRLSKNTVRKSFINRKEYPEEYKFLDNQERDFLEDFAENPLTYLYGDNYERLEDILLLLAGDKISSILRIEIINKVDEISGNLLELIMEALSDLRSTRDEKESQVNIIDHMTKNSYTAMKIFIKINETKLGRIGESGYKEIKEHLGDILLRCIICLKNKKHQKLGGKIPLKGLPHVFEIKKTNGEYSHIVLGNSTIRLTSEGIQSAKGEYYKFLEEKKLKTEHYTKKFITGLLVGITLLSADELMKDRTTGKIRGVFNMTDKDFRSSFDYKVKWLKKYIQDLPVNKDINFVDFIPYTVKIFERCGLKGKVKVAVKYKFECYITIS